MLLTLEFLIGLFSMFLISYLIARVIEKVFHTDLSPDDKKNRTINTRYYE